MKLRYMLAGTDEDFKNRINSIKERRLRFESGFRDDALHNSLTVNDDDSAENKIDVEVSETESE